MEIYFSLSKTTLLQREPFLTMLYMYTINLSPWLVIKKGFMLIIILSNPLPLKHASGSELIRIGVAWGLTHFKHPMTRNLYQYDPHITQTEAESEVNPICFAMQPDLEMGIDQGVCWLSDRSVSMDVTRDGDGDFVGGWWGHMVQTLTAFVWVSGWFSSCLTGWTALWTAWRCEFPCCTVDATNFEICLFSFDTISRLCTRSCSMSKNMHF